MERREHYDPEDIENLLQERGYDELLEEERAYVLRHLSGRDEYEAMRTLLLQVKEDDRRVEPLTVDPDVRENVMAVFRAQQRPQWQIWLNSVGTLLWPKEASAMWRPALAFATLAVLIVVGVQVMRKGPDAVKQQQMAEARPKPAAETDRSTADSMRVPSASEEQAGAAGATAQAAQPVTTAQVIEHLESPAMPAMDDASEESFAEAEAVRESTHDLEKAPASHAEPMAERELAAKALKEEAREVRTTAAGSVASHVVTADELTTNMSTANTSERSKVYAFRQKKNDSGTSLSDAPEVMALLTTGW